MPGRRSPGGEHGNGEEWQGRAEYPVIVSVSIILSDYH